MSATAEQLTKLLMHCVNFSNLMLNDAGDFYPFGATLTPNGEVRAVGGHDGSEHPLPQDIYRLLEEGFSADARKGLLIASALAANVNIPPAFESTYSDAIRVHLESQDSSRFIYFPYIVTLQKTVKTAFRVEIFEPFSVKISPKIFISAS